VLIHEQPDPRYFLELGLTQSRRFLLLSVHDHETSEVSLIDVKNPFAPPRLVSSREPEHAVDTNGSEFYAVHSWS
jgi:oligopeptidase B